MKLRALVSSLRIKVRELSRDSSTTDNDNANDKIDNKLIERCDDDPSNNDDVEEVMTPTNEQDCLISQCMKDEVK